MKVENLEKIHDVVRALRHPLRQKILQLLSTSNQMNVKALYEFLKIDQSVASQQLRILRNVGLINFTMDGKNKFYKVNVTFQSLIEKSFEEICDYEQAA